MIKTKKVSFFLSTLVFASLLFSCNSNFEIIPYDGLYNLVSVERDENISEAEIDLNMPVDSKLRIIVVNEHPQTLYGSDFQAFTKKTQGGEQWYCWFFEDCSLSEYSLKSPHQETNEYVFFLYHNSVSDQSKIDPMRFAFSWLDETAGTIRISITFQNYSFVFEG